MFLDEARMNIQPLGNQKWLVKIGGGYKPDYHTSFPTNSEDVCIHSVEKDLECELRYQLDCQKQPVDMVSAYMYYHPLKNYISANAINDGDFDVWVQPTEFTFDPNWNVFPKKFVGHAERVGTEHTRLWWETQAFQLAHGTEFEAELAKPNWRLGDDIHHPLLLTAKYMVRSMLGEGYSNTKPLAQKILGMDVIEIIEKGDVEYPHYGMIARVQAGEITIRHKLPAQQK